MSEDNHYSLLSLADARSLQRVETVMMAVSHTSAEGYFGDRFILTC